VTILERKFFISGEKKGKKSQRKPPLPDLRGVDPLIIPLEGRKKREGRFAQTGKEVDRAFLSRRWESPPPGLANLEGGGETALRKTL